MACSVSASSPCRLPFSLCVGPVDATMVSLAAPLPLQTALVAQWRAVGVETAGLGAAGFDAAGGMDAWRSHLFEVLGCRLR